MIVLSKADAASLSRTSSSGVCLHQVLQKGDTVAVVGDGKLGLLVAQVLVLEGHTVTHFGKHKHKLSLVSGTHHEVVTEDTAERHTAVSQQLLSFSVQGTCSEAFQAGSAEMPTAPGQEAGAVLMFVPH